MFNSKLLGLLQMTDPTLPIGGFAHSAGLETYVQQGIVSDVVSAKRFITGMLAYNLQYTDAAFVSLAHDATGNEDLEKIFYLDELCNAVKLPREIREASHKLGIRLLKVFLPLCVNTITHKYKEAIEAGHAYGHYSVVFGMLACAQQISKPDALTGFYYNAAAGMITNSVKLIPIGQQQGQELLFSLHPLIGQLVEGTMHPDPEMIGFCCPSLDVRCMQHERLYSRLYMS